MFCGFESLRKPESDDDEVNVNLIGDVHGVFPPLERMKDCPRPLISVGDLNLFGYGVNAWYDRLYADTTTPWVNTKPIWFVDGNHDNHPHLRHNAKKIQPLENNFYYIPRGFVSGNVLFIGGADSIDASSRIPGDDWHFQEAITPEQFERIAKIRKRIEVVVSHEAPAISLASYEIECYNRPSQVWMDRIFNRFMPKLWIHGHYHARREVTAYNCKFMSLDVNQVLTIDLPLNEKDFCHEERSAIRTGPSGSHWV